MLISHKISAVLLGLWGVAATATAQNLASTLKLAPRETLGGVVQLANHNTALFISSSETNDVRVVLLEPTGKVAGEKKITRFQFVKPVLMLGIGIGKSTQSGRERDALTSYLNPVDIFTSGNDLYTAEILGSEVDKKAKEAGLQAGQTVVQHLNEAGQLQRVIFPKPTVDKKVERSLLAHFAEGNAYYKIAQERNEREETTEHVLEVHDLTTKTVRRIPLKLPVTPERVNFNMLYNDWCFLGHRAGQTYLVRHLRGHDKKAKYLQVPIEFEVLVLDNAGQKVGGFTTTLGLTQGTYPVFSGRNQHVLEQSHIYRERSMGKYSYDEYTLLTGGLGDFYLDYATGDVLIYGEYSHESEKERGYEYGKHNEGLFVQRYGLNGEVRSKLQTAYPSELAKVQKNAFNGGKMYRSCSFLPDPVTGAIEFGISCDELIGGGGSFSLQFDKDLNYKSYSYRPIKTKERQWGSDEVQLFYVPGVWITQGTSGNLESRELTTATAANPEYTAIQKLRKKTAQTAPDARYYLTTPQGNRLLLEQLNLLGGNVSVYTL